MPRRHQRPQDQVIVEDQAYQVPKAVQACNKLINRDKVFAFVAPLGTPMNNACFKEQLAAGVPNLFPLSAARSMFEPLRSPEILRRRPPMSTRSAPASSYLVTKRARRRSA